MFFLFLLQLCRILLNWFRVFDIGFQRVLDVFFLLVLMELLRILRFSLRLVRLFLKNVCKDRLQINGFFLSVLLVFVLLFGIILDI